MLLAACSPGRSSHTEGLISRETLPGGTVVVRYGPLPAGAIVRAEGDLRLGAVDGDAHFIFGDVRGIEAGRDGTIYVLDYQAAEVRAFDAAGRFLRTVVTRGEGPGEITEANGILLVGDSVLWIQDHGKMMMLGVNPAGEELARYPMPVRSYGYIWSGTVDDAGRVWKARYYSDRPPVYPPKEGLTEGSSRAYMVSYDPAADVKDSIYLGDEPYRTMISRNSQGGYSYWQIPFDARAITVVDREGAIWRTGSTSYRVVRLSARGDTLLVIESDTPAPRVTAADRSRYVERETGMSPGDRRVAEELAQLMPETKPAIASLTVDDAGRLWVGRGGAEDADPEYDVFDGDGEYRGTVVLGFRPAPYTPIRIRQGRVYAVVRDSLDVPFVVRSGTLRNVQ
jgi:streptogramin lyase